MGSIEILLNDEELEAIDTAICLTLAEMSLKDVRGDLSPENKKRMEILRDLRKRL